MGGLALKLALIFLAIPATGTEWFVPFLHNGLFFESLDPWSAHLVVGGDSLAFPYGIVMYLALLPLVGVDYLFQSLGLWSDSGTTALGLTLLVYDLALLFTLHLLQPKHPKRLLLLYWLSPVVLYICYWHGQVDIVPMLLLMVAMVFTKRHQPIGAGLAMGAAISAKLSMLVAPPFLLVYLISNKRLRHMILPATATMAATALVLLAPLLLSDGARVMIFQSRELSKIYDVSISLQNNLNIYLLPVVYMLVLYGAWSVRRMNFELLLALIGTGFIAVVLLTPASPGWFLWIIPFVVLLLKEARLRHLIIAITFSLQFVLLQLLNVRGAAVPLLGLGLTEPLGPILGVPTSWSSLLLSIMVATGLVLCIQLVRDSILRNDYFRLSRRPLMIAVAGDSGAGKDSLVEGITALFGHQSVTHISGDDYHLWDRHKPLWQIMTHLNPQANNLHKFKQDALTLLNGKNISQRHYDHTSGRMTKPRQLVSNEIIVMSGLHTLYDPDLYERCDLRVFLDMDDRLRQYLKIKRDVTVRGYPLEQVQASIQRRAADRDRFIQPQASNADLVLSLVPLQPDTLNPEAAMTGLPRLKLKVRLRCGMPFENVVRTLIGVCGAHVEVKPSMDNAYVDMVIEGDMDAGDVEAAAEALIDNMGELLAPVPSWQGGVSGIMHLFVVWHASHSLRKRIV